MANQDLGVYFVRIGNSGGCYTKSDTIRIPADIKVVEVPKKVEGVKIYPNPSSGIFNIEMDNPLSGELVISIINQGGKEVFNIGREKSTTHFTGQIDLSGQTKGLYLVTIKLDNYTTTNQIIIR